MNEIIREKDVVYAFAENIAETKFPDLPAESVSTAKKYIMNTLEALGRAASRLIPRLMRP